MQIDRIIGRFEGKEKGPLLIVLGGMHGNEPAGVKAMELLFKMIEVEPITNPSFTFHGCLFGLRGNLKAMQRKVRFIHKDLNRQWTRENIQRIKHASLEQLDSEDAELLELITLIEKEIEHYQPTKIVLLDLHTTTAFGGIFSIATDDPKSIEMGIEFHAPVIKGLLNGINGTSLHYFNNDNFAVETIAVCFESGQHDEELSINRAIAAVINCMRTIGCVKANDVENRHDQLLIEFSKHLPTVAELVMCHSIAEGDDFVMKPGYKNFQKIKKGEVLAHDKNGAIHAQADGRILMPLYQKQGDDGFFLIRAAEDYLAY